MSEQLDGFVVAISSTRTFDNCASLRLFYLIAWFVLAATSTAYVAFEGGDWYIAISRITREQQRRTNGQGRLNARPQCPVNLSAYTIQSSRRNYVSKMTTIAASIMITASLLSTAAFAHPELLSAEPAAGAAAATSPIQIKITFTEAVIPQFSGAEVKDQAGKVMATGKATVDPANRRQLVVPVNGLLPPGGYKVEWHAVSDDTHRVKGSYTFSVAP
jgi:methionine-rich copper-binding protein CopC